LGGGTGGPPAPREGLRAASRPKTALQTTFSGSGARRALYGFEPVLGLVPRLLGFWMGLGGVLLLHVCRGEMPKKKLNTPPRPGYARLRQAVPG